MAGFEHALFLLLLLGYLLRNLPGKNQASLYLIAGGLVLVLMPPFISIQIPWTLILALVLPWIFGQNARSWLHIEWRSPLKDASLWLFTVLCLVLVGYFIGNQPWIKAILFGIVASSMLWQTSSQAGISNPLGNIGPITLVFLLVETSLVLDHPRHYLGSLLSGASVGIAFALFSIAVIKRVPIKYESQIAFGQVYLAYWSALAIGASAIAAALISMVVFTEFYQPRSDIKGPITGSALSDDRLTFFIMFGLFVFIAWQTHQPLTLVQWLEVCLSLIIGLLVTLLGRQIRLPRFGPMASAWHSTIQLGLYLLGILILWPRGPELGSVMTLIALGSAVFMPVLSAILLKALHDLNARWYENPSNGF